MTWEPIIDWMINAGIWAALGAIAGGLVVFSVMSRSVQRAAKGAFNIPAEYIRTARQQAQAWPHAEAPMYGNPPDRVSMAHGYLTPDRMPYQNYTAADIIHAAYCEGLPFGVHEHRCPMYEPPTLPDPEEGTTDDQQQEDRPGQAQPGHTD